MGRSVDHRQRPGP
jgi:hypothetical protein